MSFKAIHSFFISQSSDIYFLNSLIKSNGIICLEKPTVTFLEFVFYTIISQQISYKTAQQIWKKIIDYLISENKILKYELLNKKFIEKVHKFGVSRKKIEYIKTIHLKNIEIKSLSNYYGNFRPEEFKKKFKEFKGIGDWSCDMIQIFFFNNLNIWPQNDLIINKVINKIESEERKKIDFKQKFSPYLSLLALHFWKSNGEIF